MAQPQSPPPGIGTDLPTYKMVIVGIGGVGKSALTIQYFQKHFVADYDPTIEDSFIQHKEVYGEWCILDVLDTAGQEDYSAMREQFMRTGDGFMLVFSVIDNSSLDGILPFYKQILRVKDVDRCPMILVANKIDLVHQRKIFSNTGEEMAQKLGIPYVETSAKNPPVNVEKAFHDLVAIIREWQRNQPKSPEDVKREKKMKKKLSKKSCIVL